jgi:hypothetical protein
MHHILEFEEWNRKADSNNLNESTSAFLTNHIMFELEKRNILFDHWKTGEIFAKEIENIIQILFNDKEIKQLRKQIIKDKTLMHNIATIFVGKVKDARRILSKKGYARPKEMDLNHIMKSYVPEIIEQIKNLVK